MKKAILSTMPVTWSSGQVTKYQSILSYETLKKRTIRILSSPMPTEEEALSDLVKEVQLWDEAIKAFKTTIDEEQSTTFK